MTKYEDVEITKTTHDQEITDLNKNVKETTHKKICKI